MSGSHEDTLSVGIVCFPSLGGSGVVASEEAVGLAHRGHRIHLFSKAPPGRPLPPCERLTFHKLEVPDYPLFDYPPYTVALASALIDVARAEAIDVIHVHYAVPHAASALLARQALGPAGPRIVTSLHGTDVMRVGAHPSYRSATAFSVSQSDGVIVPSEFLKAEAYRLLQLPASVRIEVIPNFVDAEKFAPMPSAQRAAPRSAPADEAGPLLFHVSNFRPVKRVVDVLEVLVRVRRTLPARAVLVGDGPDRAAAQQRARDLGLEGCVRFLGKRTDFVAELQRADAFILPSEMESFGVAALEAMSVGVPVFGYRVGGLPELVTAAVGRLVQPFDVDALAQSVVDVFSRPGTYAALGEAARARVLERFRSEPAIARYEHYLRQIVAQPPGGTGR